MTCGRSPVLPARVDGVAREPSHRAARCAAAVLCLVLFGPASAAQTPAPDPTPPAVALPPTNVLIPNYGGVPIGEIGGLEAGAFLARADDSSSVFYNPAGLTRAEKTSVSGTAGVFQFGAVSSDDLNATADAFQQVPAMFAFVLQNLMGRNDLAAGLSVARTTAWRQTVDFETIAPADAGTNRVSYSSDARMDAWLASLGIGHVGVGKWRAGVSLDIQYTSTDRRQALADQHWTSGGLAALTITSRGEASATHLRFTAGTQYDLSPSFTLGAVVRTRGFGLMSSGLSILEGLSAGDLATTTASFLDTDPDTTLKAPFEFKGGIAYVGPRAQIEFDLLVYDGAGEYDAFTSHRPTTVIVGSAGMPPSLTQYPIRPPVIDSRAVADIAVGGHVNLTSSGSWVVHGGYGTDRSPVGPNDTLFTKVHLQKLTAGISARTSRFLGSFGLHYVAGVSDPIPLRELPGGPLATTFTVRSLGFVYSFSVLF